MDYIIIINRAEEGLYIKEKTVIECVTYLNRRIESFSILDISNRTMKEERDYLIYGREKLLELYCPSEINIIDGEYYLVYNLEEKVICPLEKENLPFYSDLPIYAEGFLERQAA